MPRRNSKHLTDPGIEKMSAAPRGKRIERFDAGAPGLALRINDKREKAWSVYYRYGGRHRRMIIGQWPIVGIEKAREQARDARAQAKAGIDPQRAKS